MQDSYYKPTPTMTREKLEEYRKKWTVDNEVGRQYRFQTETRTAGNAVNKSFQTLSLRFLPGTPKSLEEFRERLIEKYGILGLCVLRFSLGNSDFITFPNLKASISSIGVDIKPYDLNQVRVFSYQLELFHGRNIMIIIHPDCRFRHSINRGNSNEKFHRCVERIYPLV